MKKLLILGLALVCLPILAEQSILSPSEELKLDLKDATASIAKISRRIQPLAKKLDAGAKKVKKAINAVKDDPNALNKAKFEKVLADHMKPVMHNIEMVLSNELELECALTDISSEVKRVGLRLRQDYVKTEKQTEVLRADLKELARQLQKKAAEVKAAGPKPSEKLRMELKRLNQQFKLGEQRFKMANHLMKQLQAGMLALNRSSGNMGSTSGNIQLWFEHLRASRDNFRTLIRMRRDMANIASLGSRASSMGLRDLLSSFSKAMRQINQVGDLMSDIGSSVDSLEEFQQDVSFDISVLPEDGTFDVSDLADQILERDYSFLEK